jgi:hypothetical protein
MEQREADSCLVNKEINGILLNPNVRKSPLLVPILNQLSVSLACSDIRHKISIPQ